MSHPLVCSSVWCVRQVPWIRFPYMILIHPCAHRVSVYFGDPAYFGEWAIYQSVPHRWHSADGVYMYPTRCRARPPLCWHSKWSCLYNGVSQEKAQPQKPPFHSMWSNWAWSPPVGMMTSLERPRISSVWTHLPQATPGLFSPSSQTVMRQREKSPRFEARTSSQSLLYSPFIEHSKLPGPPESVRETDLPSLG